MAKPGLTIASLVTATVAFVAPTELLADDGRFPRSPMAIEHLQRFRLEHPRAAMSERAGRITRVFGEPLSSGQSARESAERFRTRHAPMFGVAADDLASTTERPLMLDRATGEFRFTALRYGQQCGGLPVFGRQMVVLVRNEPGHPVVLAGVDLCDLDGFVVEPGALPDPALVRPEDLLAGRRAGPDARVVETQLVVWAGHGDTPSRPRLAYRSVVFDDPDRWLLLTDVETGELLHRESMICFSDVHGVVTALTTPGAASEQCAEERSAPMPYLRVTTDTAIQYTNEWGEFTIEHAPRPPFEIAADLHGMWFHVVDFTGLEVPATGTYDGTPLNLQLNPSNTELTRGQVNAYAAANEVRDFVLRVNPQYPGLFTPLSIIVNRDDSHCPGNAWYDFGDHSLSFCRAGEEHPNTAWSSVVFHEYGHHLVQMSGSGQGPYGEGIGDTLSLLLLDDPRMATGFWGPCDEPLRTADNDCQFHPVGCSTCGASIHTCAQLLSGCFWSLRNELLATEPEIYRDTLATLAINSILVHTGAAITADIAVDLLTLDDDDGNLLDGTPHYHEIANAFGDHGLDAPFVPLIAFDFPEGLPAVLPPSQDLSVTVEIQELTGVAIPGTGTLHLSESGLEGTFFTVPMTEIAANLYEAIFPPLECWSSVHYYFGVEAGMGLFTPVHTFPTDAPRRTLSTMTADAALPGFTDDFEEDNGWSVEHGDTLEAGGWERGVPVGPGTRGDPRTDADGSGHCFLTENDPDDINSDVDQGSTTLVSPILDATQNDDAAFVSYFRWFSNDEGGGPYQDLFVVEVSDDGGATWSTLETVGPGGSDVSGGWIHRRFRIDEYVEPTDRFRIRFTASDTDPQSVIEAAVDGVEVRRFVCEDAGGPCLADVSGDDTVGIDDLVAILQAWGDDGGAADVDGDGTVAAPDLLMVLLAWGPCGDS